MIVPAFTFVATPLAAEQCGYRPYLVDIDESSWRLQAEALYAHSLLSEVGLVIPVAPFGRAVPQAPWLEFHRRTGIPVVIDGGASFEAISAAPSQHLGEIPVALSFHATKSFSTAEGGCVITTDHQLSTQVNQALNFGFFSTRDCGVASTNGKMSEYHAAVGLAELDGWPAKRAAFREVAGIYRRLLDAIGLGGRAFTAPDVAGCYALLRCADPVEASSVLRTFEESNIESRLWYGHGLHRQPVLRQRVTRQPSGDRADRAADDCPARRPRPVRSNGGTSGRGYRAGRPWARVKWSSPFIRFQTGSQRLARLLLCPDRTLRVRCGE